MSHQFLATLRADLCSTEWPSQQRRSRSSMTLNMFKFKRRVPWFAPFINLRTKLTPENTRCTHRPVGPRLKRPLAEEPVGPGQAPVSAGQRRLDVLVGGQVTQVAQGGHRGLPAEHLRGSSPDVLWFHAAWHREQKDLRRTAASCTDSISLRGYGHGTAPGVQGRAADSTPEGPDSAARQRQGE